MIGEHLPGYEPTCPLGYSDGAIGKVRHAHHDGTIIELKAEVERLKAELRCFVRIDNPSNETRELYKKEGGGRESGGLGFHSEGVGFTPILERKLRPETAASPAAPSGVSPDPDGCTCLAVLFGSPEPGDHHLAGCPARKERGPAPEGGQDAKDAASMRRSRAQRGIKLEGDP